MYMYIYKQHVQYRVHTEGGGGEEHPAVQLHAILSGKGELVYQSFKTILRPQAQLGWTFKGSTYCQLIRNINKGKRLACTCMYILDDAHQYLKM